MKIPQEAMAFSGPWAIILSFVISLVSLGLVAVMCLCCYPKKDEYDEMDANHSESQQNKRDDVKQLTRHAWNERASKSRAPLLTGKSIRFHGPANKAMVTEQVQPDVNSQTSLNKSLGMKSSRDSLLPLGWGSESPVRAASDTESAGAAYDDYVPTSNDQYDYSPEKLGKIQFNIKYDFQEQTLNLRVIRGVELPAKDFSGTSDPYVKIMLLPDKKHKLQTHIKRRNLNPRWNETFAFEGFPYQKLQNRTLYMQVLDYDRFSRDDPIGEIAMPLGEIDLQNGQTYWKNLQPCKGHGGKLGELLISLCYQPTVGRITIVIMKCRELKAKDITGYSDPYVKIWLSHDGKKIEKKKTSIKERNLNPVFNESFVFEVPYERIRQTSLHISVMDYDRMGRNELIGSVILGSKSGPMEVKHWNEMFQKTRQPVAQWHILKDFG